MLICLSLILIACGDETAPQKFASPTRPLEPAKNPIGQATITPDLQVYAPAPQLTAAASPASVAAVTPEPVETVKSQNPVPILMKDFIGINGDYKLYEDSTEKEFARISRWLRDYANWFCLEPEEKNYGGLDGKSGCGTAPNYFNYNAFYSNLQAAGVKVLHTSLYSPAFANFTKTQGDFVPVTKEGSGQKPVDFAKHAEFLYQIAALYGSNKNVPLANLVRPDQKTGQNLVQAIENWNEPDGWWKEQGLFTKEQLYNKLVADYNGDNGRIARAGVKQADPNLKLVMGGLATTDLGYLYGVLAYANQNGAKFPADVLNYHQYSTDGKTGLPPEQGQLEETARRVVQWRDAHAPQAEVWQTEFGWDTYASGTTHSKYYSGEQNQANWILRGLVLYRAAGIDKAFVFTYSDETEQSTESYDSSGLVTFNNHKKPAYYYLATMQDLIGDMYLAAPVTTGRDDVRAYLFRSPDQSKGVTTIWKTSGNNSKVDNFSLQLPVAGSQSCTAVVPSATSLEPKRTPLKTDGKGFVNLTVTETMTFIVCDRVDPIQKATTSYSVPTVGPDGRLNLSGINVFQTGPVALDPEVEPFLKALIDEQQLAPGKKPADSWSPYSTEQSFGFDLLQSFHLKRLEWFNAGGEGSYDVYYAQTGAYGKWQKLTTIRNTSDDYGEWVGVPLNNIEARYLQFVPRTGEVDASLGEIRLYSQP
ncbi:MAG TPA: hypothetical protein VH186_00125 [Chloroflexia bacterium]|nr:hypothetical protein [Chloroflexia bacterium]